MAFLPGEHALGQLGAAGKTVGKIQRLGNHDARITIGPVGRRGTLKRDAQAKFQGRQIAVRGTFVVRVANGENLSRKDARLGHGARRSHSGFRFENGENDGVSRSSDPKAF